MHQSSGEVVILTRTFADHRGPPSIQSLSPDERRNFLSSAMKGYANVSRSRELQSSDQLPWRPVSQHQTGDNTYVGVVIVPLERSKEILSGITARSGLTGNPEYDTSQNKPLTAEMGSPVIITEFPAGDLEEHTALFSFKDGRLTPLFTGREVTFPGK